LGGGSSLVLVLRHHLTFVGLVNQNRGTVEVGRDFLRASVPPHPTAGCPGRCQSGFEYFHRWRLCSPSGQPVQACKYPHSEGLSASVKIFLALCSVLLSTVISFGDYLSRHFG